MNYEQVFTTHFRRKQEITTYAQYENVTLNQGWMQYT
jgi:hypothetical protein